MDKRMKPPWAIRKTKSIAVTDAQWKAMRVAAYRLGISISEAYKIASAQWLERISEKCDESLA